MIHLWGQNSWQSKACTICTMCLVSSVLWGLWRPYIHCSCGYLCLVSQLLAPSQAEGINPRSLSRPLPRLDCLSRLLLLLLSLFLLRFGLRDRCLKLRLESPFVWMAVFDCFTLTRCGPSTCAKNYLFLYFISLYFSIYITRIRSLCSTIQRRV